VITDINILLKEIWTLKIFDTNIISFFAWLADTTNADSLVEKKIQTFSIFAFSLAATLFVEPVYYYKTTYKLLTTIIGKWCIFLRVKEYFCARLFS
jgi:hypothetical protein